jgi:hypothetical protein
MRFSADTFGDRKLSWEENKENGPFWQFCPTTEEALKNAQYFSCWVSRTIILSLTIVLPQTITLSQSIILFMLFVYIFICRGIIFFHPLYLLNPMNCHVYRVKPFKERNVPSYIFPIPNCCDLVPTAICDFIWYWIVCCEHFI